MFQGKTHLWQERRDPGQRPKGRLPLTWQRVTPSPALQYVRSARPCQPVVFLPALFTITYDKTRLTNEPINCIHSFIHLFVNKTQQTVIVITNVRLCLCFSSFIFDSCTRSNSPAISSNLRMFSCSSSSCHVTHIHVTLTSDLLPQPDLPSYVMTVKLFFYSLLNSKKQLVKKLYILAK